MPENAAQAPPAAAERDDTQVTNQIKPPAPDPLAVASAAPHKRGAMRRRLRKLRRERTEQFAKLGTLVLDARKLSNGSQPEVVERRAAEVAEIDRQVRELSHAVDPHDDARELATGVAGGCRHCGSLISTEDRFCSGCGTPTSPRRKQPDATAADAAATPPPPPVPGTAQAPTAPPPPPPPVPTPPDA